MKTALPGATPKQARVITPCPTCGWRPTQTTRRGPPVRIGIVLDEVLHGLGRCPRELIADARTKGDRP